jgi:hypothetical protein
MSFTGKLSNSSGPVDGSVQIIVRIFDTEAAGTGTEVWTETHTTTADVGLVYLELGATTPLDEGVFDGRALWLEVAIEGDVQSPRHAFASVPYATRAAVADSADTLGTLGPTDVALVGHDHDGSYAAASHNHDSRYAATGHNHDSSYASTGHNHDGSYLPVGSSLTCPGSQKVTGLDANGSVVCGEDTDTQNTYAAGAGLTLGTGTFGVDFGTSAGQVAAGNHNHAGAYLPLSGNRVCSGNDKVTGVNADGSVACGADQDGDTTYTAGTGLSSSGTTLSADFGTGTNQVARGDHSHPTPTMVCVDSPRTESNLPAGGSTFGAAYCPAGYVVTGGSCSDSKSRALLKATVINHAQNGFECSANNSVDASSTLWIHARCCRIE